MLTNEGRDKAEENKGEKKANILLRQKKWIVSWTKALHIYMDLAAKTVSQ